jgi:hypothetical protein
LWFKGRSAAGLCCDRMHQISYGKQRETKNGTPEIEVVTNAMLKPPTHPRKQVQGFGDMGKNDQHQTPRAEELEERAHRFSSPEQDHRTSKHHARWHQRDQRFQ